MISYLATMFGGGEGKFKRNVVLVLVTEKKYDGVDRGRKTNENVMVEGKHGGFFFLK